MEESMNTWPDAGRSREAVTCLLAYFPVCSRHHGSHPGGGEPSLSNRQLLHGATSPLTWGRGKQWHAVAFGDGHGGGRGHP
jgi:hypothetical protein